MLDEFIDNYNKNGYVKNFPFLLHRSEFGIINAETGVESYGIKLLVCHYIPTKLEDGTMGLSSKSFNTLFEIEDSVIVDSTNYKSRLEESIIKQFNRINFKDTLIGYIN